MEITLTDPAWPPGCKIHSAGALEDLGEGVGARRYQRLHQSGPWGESLFVKIFAPRKNAWKRGQGPAAAEFHAAQRLRAAGGPCLRAWAVARSGASACLLLEDCGSDTGLSREQALASSDVLKEIAQAAARLHAGNAVHRDLHLGNLLRSRDGDLRWIDLGKLSFRRRLSRQERLADLGRLIASLLPWSDADRDLFVQAYGMPGSAAETLEEAGYRRLRAHHRNLDRRARRAVHGVHPAVWRDAVLAAERATLEQARDAESLKSGHRSAVSRVFLAGGRSVVCKHYPPTKLLDPRDRLGWAKAVRSLLAAEALRRRALPAAVPLAAWSRPGAGSWLILEDLTGHRPLHEAISACGLEQRADLLRELAQLLRHMHRLGVYYRDLKPSNVLIQPAAAPGRRFVLIDHDRNRFRRKAVPPVLAARDLAALHAGLPPEVRAAERFAALRAYCPAWTTPALWRQYVRPLLREAAQRRHRWVPHRLMGGPTTISPSHSSSTTNPAPHR